MTTSWTIKTVKMADLRTHLSEHLRYLITVSMVLGCSQSPQSHTPVVRDSSGITIVENFSPVWKSGEEWRVVEPAVVEIGVVEGDEHYQLSNVRGIGRLSDGRIVVANGGSQEIRVYDSTGIHLMSLGGKGEGPGEFTSLSMVAVLPGDSIFAHNTVPMRATLFAPDGGFVRSNQLQYPVEAGYSLIIRPVAVLGDGRLVGRRSPDYLTIDFVDGLERRPLGLRILDPWTGKVNSLGTMPGAELMVSHLERGYSQALLPFGQAGDLTARDENIYVTSKDGFSVNVLAPDGSLVRIIRASWSPVAVARSDVNMYVDAILSRIPEERENELRELRREIMGWPIPKTFPPFRGLEIDAVGNVWVAEYTWPNDAVPRYTVFSPEGTMLGEVVLPRGIKRERVPLFDLPLEIGADYVLGVWKDENDVEFVRLYRLEKPAG